MADTISLVMLNSLVKRLNDKIASITTSSEPDERVGILSEAQGVLLTISSEAMSLVADVSKVIGSTSNADAIINSVLATADSKSQN